MSRLKTLFKHKNSNILNIYITAGFPALNETILIVQELEKAGVDIVEIGMPFSDPLADGPTIQASSQKAIENGITLSKIFEQVTEIRKTVQIPLILMGYFNQVLKFGVPQFFSKAREVGIDGLIIPDLPIDVYNNEYASLVDEIDLDLIFLITPQTSNKRIKMIDKLSNGFLYLVSSHSTTGSQQNLQTSQIEYFKRVKTLDLANSSLIGFGISNHDTFTVACKYANGAIIGSAFINAVANSTDLPATIHQFVLSITR
ncbi:MAG: tryptophan synthase subunit alpha [Bacteroidetes bacterium]|nr:tryptophan synthase subunit alpha [Bacteroidota bacterium]